MVSDNLQSLDSINPVEKPEEARKELTPARKDYLEGREKYKMGNYSEAAICFHNAIKGFEEEGDRIGKANAADRLGDTCMAIEDYEKALLNYQISQQVCQDEEDSFSVLSLNKKIAVCLRRLGRYDDALEILLDMIEHYYLTKNPEGTVKTLSIMAEVYVAAGKLDKAIDSYRTAASIHRNFKHKRKAEEFDALADNLESGEVEAN